MSEFTTTTDPSIWHDYVIYRARSSASKIVICEDDAQHTPRFFANPSLYEGKKHKPDIRLYAVQANGLNAAANADGRKLSAAEGKACPIVASAYFRKTGRRIGLAFGDPSRPDALHWENMQQDNLSGGRYSFTLPPADAVAGLLHFASSFSTDFSSDPMGGAEVQLRKNSPTDPSITQESDSQGSSSPSARSALTSTALRGRSLIWKRTHSMDLLPNISDLSRRLGLSNRKLVDEHTGEVLAVFESRALRSLRHLGALRVRKDLVAGLADLELGLSRNRSDGSGEKRGWWHLGAAEASATMLGIVLSWCVIEERMRRQ